MPSVYRELREECEITVDSLEEFATITFEFVNDPPLLEVHLFKSHTYSGVPTETEGDTIIIFLLLIVAQLYWSYSSEISFYIMLWL